MNIRGSKSGHRGPLARGRLPARLLADSFDSEPTKPSKPGFVGFVGATLGESAVIGAENGSGKVGLSQPKWRARILNRLGAKRDRVIGPDRGNNSSRSRKTAAKPTWRTTMKQGPAQKTCRPRGSKAPIPPEARNSMRSSSNARSCEVSGCKPAVLVTPLRQRGRHCAAGCPHCCPTDDGERGVAGTI